MSIRVRLAAVYGALMMAMTFGTPITAQSVALEPFLPFEGTIGAPGGSDSWTFTGLEGQVISLSAVGVNGLDPTLSLSNSSGQTLTTNDDYAYPGRSDALLQAITLPRIDTYTVTVSGYAQTTGDYTLMLLPGYAERSEVDDFSDTSARAWDTADDTGTLTQTDGEARFSLPEPRLIGRLTRRTLPQLTDFYAQIDIDIERAPSGWRAGLALRSTEVGYYAAIIGSQGAWRLEFINPDGSVRVVRDWTNHPAIVAGVTDFRLAVLVNGAGFDVFYNNASVGQAVETDSVAPTQGTVGLVASTPDTLSADLTVAFDNLVMTVPQHLGGANIMPSRLVTGGQALTIQELERRRVIPAGGTLALTVPESSGRQFEAGVGRILLGRGVTFTDMVLHTTFTLQAADSSALVACGLLFAHQSDTRHVVAFLDTQGGYGISARDGENFTPGQFNDGAASAGTGRHSLIVVRRGAQVDLWVDRQHIGAYTLPSELLGAGQIGNAVVNYQRGETTCNFADTWVWTF
jgi:hypothetical protein